MNELMNVITWLVVKLEDNHHRWDLWAVQWIFNMLPEVEIWFLACLLTRCIGRNIHEDRIIVDDLKNKTNQDHSSTLSRSFGFTNETKDTSTCRRNEREFFMRFVIRYTDLWFLQLLRGCHVNQSIVYAYLQFEILDLVLSLSPVNLRISYNGQCKFHKHLERTFVKILERNSLFRSQYW